MSDETHDVGRVITRLFDLPERISAAELHYLKADKTYREEKESLQKLEANSLTEKDAQGSPIISGTNATEREKQLALRFATTRAWVESLRIKKEEVKIAVGRLNNELRAHCAIARLMEGEE